MGLSRCARLFEPPAPDLAVWYQDHHGWLQGWFRRKLGCSHSAADLVQDTFMRVLTREAAPGVREPRAFLATVAHGLMVNHLRRQALERAYLEELAHRPESVDPGPEARAIVVEALMQIDALLAGLPSRAREAFLLSQLEGLRYAEIAERLGVSLSMVKKYMLQAMTHCLRPEQP